MFEDRAEAGKLLAKKLSAYQGKDAVVLALPRGGVILGHEISRILSLPLDIVAVRKIGHPGNPEYAMGAVDEYGAILLSEAEAKVVDQEWLRKETRREKEEAKRRSKIYRAGKKPTELSHKIAILVDDGIATGLTMQLAVRSTKAQNPEKVIVAVPVAPWDAINTLKKEGAEVVVLEEPEEFMGSVGMHYREFVQVGDEEVIEILRKE